MRKIDEIIIHSTATKEGKNFTVEDIRNWHVKGNKWSDIGYHYVIYLDGSVHIGRPLDIQGAHTVGHNKNSVGVVYVGGADEDGKPKDTRTPEQKKSLKEVAIALKLLFPITKIHGHRYYAKTGCPSFDVEKWVKEEGIL